MTGTEACIALNMVPNLGPMRLRKLLDVFETPERVLLARGSELREVEGIGKEVAEGIATWEQRIDLAGELQRIQDFGARVITQESPEYPAELKEIYNPPIVLYVWGTIEPKDHRAIAVVGARQSSHYGLDCAKKLSYQMAYAGLTVISGLARGIDTAAHQGALAAQGRTLAVIGSGFHHFYPPENLGLAEKIAASGAVITEYPFGVPPAAANFPYRNRIVAGWGIGLLVVEAGLKSGALITAGQALEHGRQVYAVPGPIDRPSAMGSNRLIQQGAKLITSAGDILEDMDSLFPPEPKKAAATSTGTLSPEEQAILEALAEGETSLDDLAEKTRLPTPKVSASLLALEMKRLVKTLPGAHFIKL